MDPRERGGLLHSLPTHQQRLWHRSHQVLDLVSGMDTGKVQKAIAEMPNEGVVNVVQEDRLKSVHVGNKQAELFQVGGVLMKHDRSDGSTGLWGNHKRLDWWDRVNPRSSSSDGLELGSGHHSSNMTKDATASVGGHGVSCCIEGCFKGLDLGSIRIGSSGNAGDGVGNRSCHGRKYFGME